MLIVVVRILVVVTVAVYLVLTGAHLFELSAKLAMSPSDYMVVPGIYRGWLRFGIAIFPAMLLTLLHAVMRRGQRIVFILSLISLLCLIGTQIIFWLFTYPMNVLSGNWTVPRSTLKRRDSNGTTRTASVRYSRSCQCSRSDRPWQSIASPLIAPRRCTVRYALKRGHHAYLRRS
jgi:hypothetical protein